VTETDRTPSGTQFGGVAAECSKTACGREQAELSAFSGRCVRACVCATVFALAIHHRTAAVPAALARSVYMYIIGRLSERCGQFYVIHQHHHRHAAAATVKSVSKTGPTLYTGAFARAAFVLSNSDLSVVKTYTHHSALWLLFTHCRRHHVMSYMTLSFRLFLKQLTVTSSAHVRPKQ